MLVVADKRASRRMGAATKRARAARVMVTAMRVVGNKVGDGGKGHRVGTEDGAQQTGRWRWWVGKQ
jgi:hypothetical protein